MLISSTSYSNVFDNSIVHMPHHSVSVMSRGPCDGADNLVLLVLWLVWLFLFYYVSVSLKGMEPFDPYPILQVDRGATIKEIKKAFRGMSKLYHPDMVWPD
jgi:DnaJ-domain-containing protein 1